jgi:hypothetical protein
MVLDTIFYSTVFHKKSLELTVNAKDTVGVKTTGPSLRVIFKDKSASF